MDDETLVASNEHFFPISIPGYRILEILGRGGMATVYLAEQINLGRQVALKVLSPDAIKGADWGDRFLRETKILAQFNDRNIVSIYDAGVHEGHYFLSMERLNGGVLTERINKGLSTEKSVQIIIDIANALKIAHESGFVHRDLKPDNIMFRSGDSKEAILTDFGIARVFDKGKNKASSTQLPEITTVHAIVGSLAYMSPEQATAEKLDSRSDIFSLGVCFYFALTQKRPYNAIDLKELREQHYNTTLTELPASLNRYQNIIDRMLAAEKEDRYENVDLLITDLSLIKPLEKSKDKTVTQIYSPGLSHRKKIIMSIAGSLAMAIVAIMVAIFYVVPNTEKNSSPVGISSSYSVSEVDDYQKAISNEITISDFNNRYPGSIFSSVLRIKLGETDELAKLSHYAEEGSGPALFLMSEVADQGLDEDLDRKDAVKYARLSSDTGFSLGMIQLAVLLMDKPETAKDIDIIEAKNLLLRSASEKNALANRVLGIFTINGMFPDLDANSGIAYLAEASNLGDSKSSELLAIIYSQGELVPPNETLASKYSKISRGEALKD